MSNPNDQEFTLKIEGMTCGHCSSRVQKALAQLPGVVSAAVDLETGTAAVSTAGAVAAADLVAAVETAGYSAQAV